MTALEALQLEDPEGSVMVISRVENSVYTVGITYSSNQPFRLFEDDRAKVRDFLRALDG